MADITVFEQTMLNFADWSGEGDAPAYPVYEGEDYVALVDRYPKFVGQVVVFPQEGRPGEDIAPYDLPARTRLGLDYLSHVVQSRMRTRFPQGRIVRHEEGFAVPDHPHVVLYPAQRGEGRKLYEPSGFEPDTRYFKTTQQLLKIEEDQKKIVDARLKKLLEAIVDWT